MTHLFAGVDSMEFPGIGHIMQGRGRSNIRWMGYYLIAPSRPTSPWLGWRGPLEALGIDPVPIYVGRELDPPGAPLRSGQQGTLDAVACADELQKEGFTVGRHVYLDLENGPPAPVIEQEYVNNFRVSLGEHGFMAGVYCSHLLVPTYAKLFPGMRIWCWNLLRTVPIQSDADTVTTNIPVVPGATMIQFAQNMQWNSPFGEWLCDWNVSTIEQPSR